MSGTPPNLSINPITGVIHTIFKNGTIRVAGYRDKRNYVMICTNGKTRGAHQLIWESVNGLVPCGLEIDHINGDPSDNRIGNLRLVTHSQNMQNTRKASGKNKTSGVKGVHYDKARGKWRTHIVVSGKQIHIGRFDSIGDAKKAYNNMAAIVHTHNPHASGE